MTLSDRLGRRLEGRPVVKWVVLPLAALTALFSALVVVALLVAGLAAERLLRRLTGGRQEDDPVTE